MARRNTGSPTSPSTPEFSANRSKRSSLDGELSPSMDRFGQAIDIAGRSGRKNTGTIITPRGSFSTRDGSGRETPSVKKGSKEFAENYQPLLSARLGVSDQSLHSSRRGHSEPSTPRKGDNSTPRRGGSKEWDNKVSLILASGSDIDPDNVRNEKEDPIYKEFYDAVTNGNLAVVSRILDEKKVNVNYRDNLDTTAIWRAAWDGQLSMVQLLVKYGADINFATLEGTGYTCLHAAAQDGHLAVVRHVVLSSLSIVSIIVYRMIFLPLTKSLSFHDNIYIFSQIPTHPHPHFPFLPPLFSSYIDQIFERTGCRHQSSAQIRLDSALEGCSVWSITCGQIFSRSGGRYQQRRR